MADPRSRGTQFSDLPMDVLGPIADRIGSFGDCVRFDSIVRGFANGSSSSSSRQLQKLRNFPWLVIEVDETNKFLCFFSGHDFFPIRTQLLPAKEATCCIGSFFGWLFMADSYLTVISTDEICYLNNYLLNPCTNQRIQLPRSSNGGAFGKVVMSDADDGLLAMTDRCLSLAFCRIGDEEWSPPDSPTRFTCRDIVFFKGVLYVVVDDYYSKIMAIDFRKDRGMQERILTLQRHPKSEVVHRRQYTNFYLVESDGELLLVVEEVKECCRNTADHGNRCRCYGKAISFCVLMLDFSEPRWVELTTLGNRMLLLDWACSVSLDAMKFTRFGFRPNCIYYTNRDYPNDYGWHEFCLEDNKIVPFGCDFSTLLPLIPRD